jgi:hypothetical protein
MKLASYTDDLPAGGDAIIVLEETDFGWRGLTAKGELLNVRCRNGHKAAIPDGDVVMIRRKCRHEPPRDQSCRAAHR